MMTSKKLLCLFVSLLLVFSLVGCGASEKSSESDDTKKEETKENNTEETTDDEEDETVQGGGVYEYENISITLPDDFVIDESGENPMAYSVDYPTVTDNIAFTKSDVDSIDNYDQATLDSYYSSLLEGFESSDYFEKTQLNGNDTIVYEYKLTVNDIKMVQTQLMIFTDEMTTIVSFTQSSGEYAEAFTDAIGSIEVNG